MAEKRLSSAEIAKLIGVRFGLGFLALGLMFFVPAGTLRYWQAWAWLAVLMIPMTGVLIYLVLKDRALLERRLKTREKEKEQSLFVKLSLVWFGAAFLIPGFDRRFHWSNVPLEIEIASLVLVFLGYCMFIMVMRENSYASRVVEVEAGQKVIDTGPYAVVRHPLYLGSVILYAFTPLALGSYWAIIPMWMVIPLVILLRIPNEEKVLLSELPGYAEYMQKVKWRLIPGVW